MSKVVMYCTPYCPYCVRARMLLTTKGADFEEIRLDLEPNRREEMERRAGGLTSVPQIFIGERHIGGCDELYALESQGELDPLLEN